MVDFGNGTSLHSVRVVGYVLASLSAFMCLWSCIAILSSRKLRKPVWIFRFSVSIKDILLCAIAFLPFTATSEEPRTYELYLSGLVIACISSSVFTLLCASIDRYHAATRPFRYHMGDLMPVGVAMTLLLNCWTIGVIVGIATVSDYNQSTRHMHGALLYYVSLERWQKGLLLSGVTAVYVSSGLLLTKAEFSVARQKRETRLRLEGGMDEPTYSRKNSASDDPQHLQTGSDSEADQMLFKIDEPSIELKKTKRKWSLKLTQKVGFFTPVTYRPSILRRIRDTWYLNAVLITWAVSFVTTMLPLYYFVIAGDNCTTLRRYPVQQVISNTTTPIGSTQPAAEMGAHCVMSIICDYLLLSHGFVCSIIYIFIDDVFRPIFLWPVAILLSPFRCCRTRGGSQSTAYGSGRRRTLSRNSNIMTHGL